MNNNDILSVMYETAKGLTDAQIMGEQTLREFDALCVSEPKIIQSPPAQA
jgi:DNA-binding transcriptional regulator YiaG